MDDADPVAHRTWSRSRASTRWGGRSPVPSIFETRLTDYLEAWFRDWAFAVERQPVAPGRDNLLAWYDAPQLGG